MVRRHTLRLFLGGRRHRQELTDTWYNIQQEDGSLQLLASAGGSHTNLDDLLQALRFWSAS